MKKIDFIMEMLARMYPSYSTKWKEKRLKEKIPGVSGAYLGKVSRLIEKKERPFRVLISTILSQRTRDEDTEHASQALFEKYHTPKELMDADTEDIEKRIHRVGFSNKKSIVIKEVARIIHERYQDEVPENFEELVNLPGVGRKTANCVLVFGFEKPAIPVDTHVHRISNRLGLVHTKTPEKTEEVLMQNIPKKYWLDLNGLFVTHGKTICKPLRPLCEKCLLTKVCDYYKSRIKTELKMKESKIKGLK